MKTYFLFFPLVDFGNIVDIYCVLFKHARILEINRQLRLVKVGLKYVNICMKFLFKRIFNVIHLKCEGNIIKFDLPFFGQNFQVNKVTNNKIL